jgi:hypothetical protein
VTASDATSGPAIRCTAINENLNFATGGSNDQVLSGTNHPDMPVHIGVGSADRSDPGHVKLIAQNGGPARPIDGRLQNDGSVQWATDLGRIDNGQWEIEEASRMAPVEHDKLFQLGYDHRLDAPRALLNADGSVLVVRTMVDPKSFKDGDHLDLWDAATGKKINGFDAGGFFAWMRFADDGQSITGFDNGSRVFRRLAIPSGKLMAEVRMQAIFVQPTSAHAFFLNDTRVAVSTPAEGVLRIFDHEKKQLLHQFTVPVEGTQNLTVSPNGKTLAFWQFAPNTPVRFYDVATGRQISLQSVNPQLEEFGFTPDQTQFVEITDDGLVLVNISDGELLVRRGSGPFWRGAEISASGNRIAQSTSDIVYDLPGLNVAHPLLVDGNVSSGDDITLSGDGNTAMMQVNDGNWGVWHLPDQSVP